MTSVDTVNLLRAANLDNDYGIVGLDGFVDRIIRAISKKHVDGTIEYYPTITAFSERCGRAAGKSACIEKHVQQVKLGGNGPIMANALAALGLDLTYVGAVGAENGIHPVFQPMAKRADVINLCDAAKTDALEFNDGKLMFQEMISLDSITYDRIVEVIGREELIRLMDKSTFAAFNHWTAIMSMNDIWRKLQEDICPEMSKDKDRKIFFDLADPQKRSNENIAEALQIISNFTEWYYTILGLNERESEHICQVLDCEPGDLPLEEKVKARAIAIREKLDIDCVTVHPVICAAVADRNGAAVIRGPYTPKPKISTGAGDHFNSGFCMAHILGGSIVDAAQCGVGVSGFYVRNAKSPSLDELADFIESLAE